MECDVRMPGSLWLDARELDHLSPFLNFIGDEFAELGGRARKHHSAEVSKSRLQLMLAALITAAQRSMSDMGMRARYSGLDRSFGVSGLLAHGLSHLEKSCRDGCRQGQR